MKIMLLTLLFSAIAQATPYPFPERLLTVKQYPVVHKVAAPMSQQVTGSQALRVQIDWKEGESYQLGKLVLENSATDGLLARATKRDPWGSYIAELTSNGVTYYDSIGTGKEYRRLARSLSFRFPAVNGQGSLKLWAENPQTGVHEVVLEERIDSVTAVDVAVQAIETKVLQEATLQPSLVFAIYADGYTADRKARFFSDAQRAVQALTSTRFPEVERFRFVAVFAPSKTKLGRYQDHGRNPVPRDAFLGLYFPHWNPFGRWYNVVYPTDEAKLRAGFGQVAYDYPLVIIDDAAYWGVGNYRMYTAIPGSASQFEFLLLHEFGHFLGLNEEYEENGRTELEFAPEIEEPWSFNMTFHPHRGELKWESLVAADTPLPTPAFTFGNKVGAYKGGYAGSAPDKNYKPAKECMMNYGGDFCPVCKAGILTQLHKDSGTQN